MRRTQRGLTSLELMVVVGLIVALAGTLLNALHRQQEEAEKLGMELTVMAMRTGLLSEMAERLIKGGDRSAGDLVGVNPARWLKAPPQGYLGEYKDVNESLIPPGSWYFDQNGGEMVYKLNRSSQFRRLEGGEKKEIRWRVQARSGSGKKVLVEEIVLVPTTGYEWF